MIGAARLELAEIVLVVHQFARADRKSGLCDMSNN